MGPLSRSAILAVAVLLVYACADESPTTLEPEPAATRLGPPPGAALPARVNALVHALYPLGDRSEPNSAVAAIKAAAATGGTAGPEVVAFVAQLLSDQEAGLLSDPNDAAPPTLVEAVTDLINLVSEMGGLPAPFPGLDPLTEDAAWAVVGTGGGALTVPSGQAGVEIPAGALTTDAIVVVRRIADPAVPGQGPLVTTRRQYGPFYDFSTTPHVAAFAQAVTVGICPRPVGDPFGPEAVAIAVRLELGHPDPANASAVEILNPVPDLLPCGGLAGETTSFSPFAALGPNTVLPLTGNLGVSGHYSCAIRADALTDCWGLRNFGRLGDGGPIFGVSGPVDVAGDPVFLSLDPGGIHMCGDNSLGILCWGQNNNFGHVLANGTALPASVTVPTPLAAGPYVSFSAGRLHACGTTNLITQCWGLNQGGEVGDGTTTQRFSPVQVIAPVQFTILAAGWLHSCAITLQGEPWCWGRWRGQNDLRTALTPEPLPGGHQFDNIYAGHTHTCGMKGFEAWCWGDNSSGQIGNGAVTLTEENPVQVLGGLSFWKVAPSLGPPNFRIGHTCGITTVGVAYCWGLNSDGQLGDGTTVNSLVPIAVNTTEIFADIGTGERFTCAMTPDRRVFCWGSNANAELGSGVAGGFSATPVQVF